MVPSQLGEKKTQEFSHLAERPEYGSALHEKSNIGRIIEDISSLVQQRRETAAEHEVELTNSCEECAKKIPSQEFDTYEGLCRECYYRKINGDIMRDTRRSGVLGKDRTW